MKVMVVGGGGREHAIIKKLKENEQITQIFALPGNGGISLDAQCVAIKATDIQGICDFAKQKRKRTASVLFFDIKFIRKPFLRIFINIIPLG